MSKRPWLTYGLDDGLDMVHLPKLPQPKKFSRTLFVCFFFCSVGGHRFYLGDKKGGIRLLLFFILLQFIMMIFLVPESLNGVNKQVAWLSFIALIGWSVFVAELISLKGRMRRYNVSITSHNKNGV